MSDFLPVLAAGFIILAALFLLFGGLQIGPAPQRGAGVGEEEAPLPPPVSGIVGYPQQGMRDIPIANSFSVSFESGEKPVASLRNSSVENGVFGRVDREISFDAPSQDLQSARIKLNVTDTNLYGNLVVVLNGNTVFNNYSLPGRLEVQLNASALKLSGNILQIEASSSSWRIWAPTVYKFDADLLLNYFSLNSSSFDFVADSGIQSISQARLVLVISKKEGSGNLIARVNGNEVYRGNDTRIAIADFPASDINLGKTNTAEFLAEKGASYDISSAEVLLFYQPVFRTQALYYNLTGDQYSSFTNATLGFGIQKITGNVISILVKVTDGAGGAHSIIPQGILQEGNSYNITLTKDQLYTGSNRIEFVTGGTGSVSIVNATVIQ